MHQTSPSRRRRPRPDARRAPGAWLLPAAALLALAAPAAASASAPGLSVVAGDGTNGTLMSGPALSSPMDGQPGTIVTRPDGSLLVDDYYFLAQIDPDGQLTRLGDGTQDPPVPGPVATSPLGYSYGFGGAPDGTAYYNAYESNHVLRISPSGTLSIVAGNGTRGPSVPGPALDSPAYPYGGVAAKDDGTFYFVDAYGFVNEVTPDGMLSVVAGNGASGSPVAGPALDSPIGYAPQLGLDDAGNLYITDENAGEVLEVTPGGQLSIVAGDGTGGPPTPGPATSSSLGDLMGLAVTGDGGLYLSDASHDVVEHVTPSGTLSVVAGNGTTGAPVAGPPTASPVDAPTGLGLDGAGVLYVQSGGDFAATHVLRIGPAEPSAPRDVTVTRDGGQATLSFLAPLNGGVTPVTGYEVSLDGGATWTPVATTAGPDGRLSATLSGLTGAGASSVLVRARNASGTGPSDAGTVPALPTPSGPATAAAADPGPPATSAAPAPVPATVRRCAATRRVTLHWRVPAGTSLRSVRITVNGRLSSRPRATARSARLVLRATRRTTFAVRIAATATTGRRLSGTRTYHACVPRRASAAPPLTLIPR